MQQTYHLRMDDGKRLDLPSDSAANAIGKALSAHLGHRVTHCWLGTILPSTIPDQWATELQFDIPPHEPLFAKVEPKLRKAVRGEVQLPGLDDKQIINESERAFGNAVQE